MSGQQQQQIEDGDEGEHGQYHPHDPQDYKKRAKDKYAFWETQPVVQFTEPLKQVRDLGERRALRVS